MPRTIRLSLVLLLSVFYSACKDLGSSNIVVEVPKQIIPLKVGNEWNLRITWYDSSGNITHVGFDTVTVVRDTTIQNEQWFIWANNGGITTNRQDGYWWRFGNMSRLVTKYPVKRNDTYVYGEDTTTFLVVRIISTDSVISVPAGSFSCVVYEWRWSYGPLSTVECYAPHRGQIRYDTFLRTSSGREYLAYRFETTAMKLSSE